MSEHIIERHIQKEDDGSSTEHTITTKSPSTTQTVLARVSQVTLSIGALVSGVVLIRFMLKLFNANATNGFVDLIYGLTQPIISPFEGILSVDTAAESTGGTFEIASVAAIIVVSFIAWMLARFMQDAASDA